MKITSLIGIYIQNWKVCSEFIIAFVLLIICSSIIFVLLPIIGLFVVFLPHLKAITTIHQADWVGFQIGVTKEP